MELLKEIPEKVQYVIVSESGASVYSASKLATEEFPNFDVGQRSAASIARSLQDPLAELVKIDPKAIGVGQYQHDMNQKRLSEALGGVVEDSVNKVGVDLNTASAPLLEYISGITKTLAKNIVAYREANGRFADRRQLLKVPKLGPKAYEQCAGFLRIMNGDNPLDATSVHPESYEAATKLLTSLGYSAQDIAGGGLKGIFRRKVRDPKETAAELGVGELTLQDIVQELEKPARDPRDEMPRPVLRSDVLDMKDLTPGMVLKGTVRNIMDFGAFVDIGVHQDGLVHVSEMSEQLHQTSAGCGQSRRRGRREGAGGGCAEEADLPVHEAAEIIFLLHKQKNRVILRDVKKNKRFFGAGRNSPPAVYFLWKKKSATRSNAAEPV